MVGPYTEEKIGKHSVTKSESRIKVDKLCEGVEKLYESIERIGNELEVYSIHVDVYLRGSFLVNKIMAMCLFKGRTG